MSGTDLPTRAILNFAYRCVMKCEWCYVPFDAGLPRRELVLSLVRRLADLGFRTITFGGGDPFQYRFVTDVLPFAKSLDLFVHVDTHGLSLRQTEEVRALLESSVDLLGLPIDGSSAVIHDSMRGSPGHFDVVMRRLDWLGELRGRLKLNTVISAVNISDIDALAARVAEIRPARWSIYQYWPLGPAARADVEHRLIDSTFFEAAERVQKYLQGSGIAVEANARDSRRDTYPIIHHDGTIFVHTRPPEDKFVTLGSIFDDDALDRILEHCYSERSEAASRYLAT